MSTTPNQAILNGFVAPLTVASPAISLDFYHSIFEENRHKIYSLAFWMTDNEITAEEISTTVFARTFARTAPDSDRNRVAANIDRNLISVLREYMPIGQLTLNTPITATEPVYGNTKRIQLERAVVQIPSTERLAFLMHDVEGYSHVEISRILGITIEESQIAVCQARILVRELVAQMN